MKVLQINVLARTLSTGRTTREMHDYFLNNGIKSYIACPAPLDCEDAYFFSSRIEMRIDTVMTMLTGLEAHHSRIQTKRLIEYIKKIRPDIVHMRVLHSNCINLHMLLRFLAKNDIPTVVTLHDFWYLTGRCCYFSNLKCEKWVNGCENCRMPNNKSRPLLFNRSKKMWLDKKNDFLSIRRLAFVGVSDYVVSEAIKSPMCSKAIVKRIYNWIDLKTFKPNDRNNIRDIINAKNKFVVLGVSASWKIGSRKGLITYLKLAEKMPDNYLIVLVGKIDCEINLPRNIISIGILQDTKELASIYSAADVYLNVSTEETFGKVTAESLACGTPVVAIDATANKELIQRGCGIVIKSLEISNILEALRTIEINGKDYYKYNCVSFSENNFNMRKNICEYINLYNRLLEQ